jgi:hypothetical protein
MARQSNTPVSFNRTTRRDENTTMTSARAGKVVPVTYFPLLRGDSASGRVGVDVELAEMPRPLLNGVVANFQAWFVPKSAHPQFSGMDEFIHSYQGEQIKALGAADRDAPDFFTTVNGASLATVAASEFFKTLGLHVPAGTEVQTDLIDAFWLVYNFRLAAHSSRLPRASYAAEDIAASTTLPPAFWPSGRRSRIVPDYERALIVGSMDFDVTAGRIPVKGIAAEHGAQSKTAIGEVLPKAGFEGMSGDFDSVVGANWDGQYRSLWIRDEGDGVKSLFADMAGATFGTSLADIDMARTTQAFAKLRTAYAGNDATGFDNDDAIVAELMQGFRVPDDQFKRPWLLDSARVPFGMVERHATDAANLDASVSQGRASAMLSLNVPQTETGGTVIVTVEVLPERLDERQTDEWLHITSPSALPNALRDVQRPEPVDMVLSRRIDAAHTDPDSLYGYEPMNDVWNRATTRLGGSFYQPDPQNPWTEQRSAIWMTSIVDPEFTADHWLAPVDFPHDVFSDTTADAFEVVARHSVSIAGLTQIGDILEESNDDYAAVIAASE